MKQYKVILKLIMALALPIVFANIVSASSGLISMFFIASINSNALAAGALITSTQGLVMVMVVSVLYSVSILVGQSHGAGRHTEVSPIVWSGIAIAAILGACLSCILWHMQPILLFLHQPVEVSVLAGDYFKGAAFGLIPSLMIAVFTQFFMGISKTKLLLYFTSVGVFFNGVLSYVLIFGVNTLPPLGLFGAGLANALTSYFILAITVVYIFFASELKHYTIFSKTRFNVTYCKSLLKIGVPISVQYSLELLAFSIITYLMGLLGTDALSAQQITLQCSMVAIMVVMGFSQSGSILISQNLAKGTALERQCISDCTLGLGGLCMLGIGLVYWLFPNTLIAFYLDSSNAALSDMVSLARTILYIAAFTQLFDAGRNIAAGLLRGYGDTQSSLWTSLISCWVIGLPLALFFAFFMHLGAVGLRLGILFGILFGSIQLIHRLYQINKTQSLPFLHQNKAGTV